MARRPGHSSKRSRSGRLRIVAGKWRSRLLRLADDPSLRPTSERIRETLFNWLAPSLDGASCLDLFAGSGALGLEALSRGAGQVVFVEQSTRCVKILRENIALLDAAGAEVLHTDALNYLRCAQPVEFDLVFVDPPFAADLYGELCRLLQENGWLAENARIYIEQPRDVQTSWSSEGWTVLKEKTAGNVGYFLLQVAPKSLQ